MAQAVASNDNQDEQQQDSSSNPSYSTGAGEYSGSGGGDGQSGGDGGNVPSAPSGDNPEDNPLLDQLLSTQEQGGGDFHTTSAEVRVGALGCKPSGQASAYLASPTVASAHYLRIWSLAGICQLVLLRLQLPAKQVTVFHTELRWCRSCRRDASRTAAAWAWMA